MQHAWAWSQEFQVESLLHHCWGACHIWPTAHFCESSFIGNGAHDLLTCHLWLLLAPVAELNSCRVGTSTKVKTFTQAEPLTENACQPPDESHKLKMYHSLAHSSPTRRNWRLQQMLRCCNFQWNNVWESSVDFKVLYTCTVWRVMVFCACSKINCFFTLKTSQARVHRRPSKVLDGWMDDSSNYTLRSSKSVLGGHIIMV